MNCKVGDLRTGYVRVRNQYYFCETKTRERLEVVSKYENNDDAGRLWINDMRYINPRFTYLLTYLPATVDKLGCQMSNYGHHVSPVYGPVLQFSCLIDRGAQSASPDHF